jgi:hypothetical protein
MYAQLPATFVNLPNADPLVLMFDLQLRRPLPGKGPEAWPKVGVPVPETRRPFGQWFGAAIEYRGVTYVAYEFHLYMSADGAKTWSALPVHRFWSAQIKCRIDKCFALLSMLGSEWDGLYTVDVGKNDWKELGSLAIGPAQAALAAIAAGRSPVKYFGAADLLPTEQGVLVSGIVNAGMKAWGAVLRARADARLEAVGTSVDDGLWRLERDPQGTIWAGGEGAFQLRDNKWQRVWLGE